MEEGWLGMGNRAIWMGIEVAFEKRVVGLDRWLLARKKGIIVMEERLPRGPKAVLRLTRERKGKMGLNVHRDSEARSAVRDRGLKAIVFSARGG